MCPSHDTIQEVAGPPASTQKPIVKRLWDDCDTQTICMGHWQFRSRDGTSKRHIELYIYAIMHADSRSFGLTLIVHWTFRFWTDEEAIICLAPDSCLASRQLPLAFFFCVSCSIWDALRREIWLTVAMVPRLHFYICLSRMTTPLCVRARYFLVFYLLVCHVFLFSLSIFLFISVVDNVFYMLASLVSCFRE